MRTIASSKLLGVTLAVACAFVGATPAAASFDFLFSASHVSNDDQLFLNLTVSNYGYPRTVVEPLLPRIAYVEADLPVILFLARQSGRPPAFFVDLRAGGASWSVVFAKARIPMDVLFVGIDRDPGPPYGKAWGYWRKHGRGSALSDADIQGLARVQVGGRISGLATYDLARGGGDNVAVRVADKKGRSNENGKIAKGPSGEKGNSGKGGNKGKGGKGQH
jgi:hypothetical protein